jgi:hypothetical protein
MSVRLQLYIKILVILSVIHDGQNPLEYTSTVKPVLNGPFIKWNFVLNGNIFSSRDYHNIPWLNGNVASAEKCSGPLSFRLRQVLLYLFCCMYSSWCRLGCVNLLIVLYEKCSSKLFLRGNHNLKFYVICTVSAS